MPRANGPFEVLQTLNDNAYKVNFPGDYGVSTTFNVVDLSPYLKHDHLANLKANSPQQKDDDGGPCKGLHQEPQDSLEGSSSRFKVKDKVLASLDQLLVLPRLREINKPSFVCFLEGNLEGIIFYHTPPPCSLRPQLSNKLSHKVIWSPFGLSTRAKPEAAVSQAQSSAHQIKGLIG